MKKFYVKFNWRSMLHRAIESVDVFRETDSSVFIGDSLRGTRREAKRTEYGAYCDSWEEARSMLEQRAHSEVLAARRELELANSYLGNVKGLKPPKSGMDAA